MTGQTQYTPEMADKICEMLSEGVSLRSICRGEGMPHFATVMRWVAQQPTFCDQYARATLARADAKFEELDDVSEQAATAESAVTIAGLRLKADNIKWQLARMNAKKYGDKITQEHTGADGKDLVVSTIIREYMPPKDE